tara:strand:+ start:4052 stop:4993 length:942 start_codon:yes stop_codon:yes gene_type:complete
MKKKYLKLTQFYQKFKKGVLNFPKRSFFWYPLILSFFSASIFYYFFNYIPREQEYEKVKPQVEYLTDKILWDGMFIVTEMTHQNISQDEYHYGNISIEEFENALTEIYFDTKLKYEVINSNGKLYSIGDFVSDYLSNIKKNVDILLRYIIYLDPEEINIINELLRNKLFESWDISRFRMVMNIGKKSFKIEREDLSKFKLNLFNLYQTLQKLDKYAHKNVYTKLKSLRIKAANAYFLKKYNLSSKYNFEILKLKNNDKEAMFYYGASLLAENRITIGKEVLTNFLQLYPEQIEFFKSNIGNEFVKKEILNKIE